ncbi:MAG TPA: HAD family phosphatase, partial [Terricaulis sp.]|nr:HAD family phosphatase [Terricaulis sp.]
LSIDSAEALALAGVHTVLVSGGFTFFTSRVAEVTGFHRNYANVLKDDGKALTGEVQEPILGRAAKLETLMLEAKQIGQTADAALAIGDGANDLDMIKAAGLGVAFKAKPVVAAEADARIDHTSLETALFLQGYRRGEFA